MRNHKFLLTIILFSLISLSSVSSLRAKRGEKKRLIDLGSDDLEKKVKNLGGTEEAIVKESMQNIIGKRNEEKLDHKNKIEEHKKTIEEYADFKKRSKSLIKELKKAKNREEYDKMLSGYKTLVEKFKKKFEGCLPPPPPAPMKRKRAPTESRCHSGFRSGWKHGKQWAILITADQGTYEEGLKRVNCLTSWLRTKKDSIYSICALRGAVQGYKKWYRLRTHREELEEYITKKRLRESAIYENEEYYQKVMQKVEGK